MKTLTRLGGTGLVVLACGWLLVGGRGLAQQDKGPKAVIQKIADALESGDKAAATAQAKALAKDVEDFEDVMGLFQLRKKDKKVGGIGIGKEAGIIMPDGIEKQVMALSQTGITAGDLDKHAKAFQRMGYVTAAVMEVALAKEPEKDMGTKTRKLWRDSATSARAAALELAQAARAKNAEGLKKAAVRLDRSCNDCHGEFKN
jgi:hypothetical protein